MEKPDSLIGRIIDQKYEIVEKIGAGGQATVYKAFQKNLERHVALKIINEEIRGNELYINRFIREAKDLAGIEHPNVVRIYDFGRDDDLSYIVMELLTGSTLDKIIYREKALAVEMITFYLSPIADAIQTLHNKGLIHRDIKSANIFITELGRPVLMDFGIAHATKKTISFSELKATPQYMSPEQATGKKLDERSDLYSLGIVLFECLTGNVPFEGEDITTILHKVIHEKPEFSIPAMKNTPEWIQHLILKLLSKNPEDRLGSAKQVFEVLQNHTLSKRIKIRNNLNKQIILLIGAIAILLIIGSIMLFLTGRKSRYEGSKTADTELLAETLVPQAEDYFKMQNFELSRKYFQRIANSSQTVSSNVLNKLKQCTQNIADTILKDAFVEIQGGTFIMGSENGGIDERPPHDVTIKSFRINKYEITNRQFCIFLNAYDCKANGYIAQTLVFQPIINKAIKWDGNKFVTSPELSDYPVFGTTWFGAAMFCKEFGGRLPTEAEWEYVAQAEDITQNHSENLTAWFAANSGRNTHKVGTKRANALGIYDLGGNVWEWCEDNYTNYKSKSLTTGKEKSGTLKTIRGGDIFSPAGVLRPAYRSNAPPEGNTGDFIGFRMVLDD